MVVNLVQRQVGYGLDNPDEIPEATYKACKSALSIERACHWHRQAGHRANADCVGVCHSSVGNLLHHSHCLFSPPAFVLILLLQPVPFPTLAPVATCAWSHARLFGATHLARAVATALRYDCMAAIILFLAATYAPLRPGAFCWLRAWAGAELMWYIFCESEKERLQAPSQPAQLSAAKRLELWGRCVKWSENPRQWIQGWFNNTDFELITRPDILDFLAWGFWGSTANQLDTHDRQQLLFMVRELEQACSVPGAPSYSFPPRRPSAAPLPVGTYTLQPMANKHVPLLFYVAMHAVVDSIMAALLWAHGFETFTPTAAPRSMSFSVRLPASAKRRGRREGATAAGRGRSSTNGSALVVLHGIGIGALPYWGLIKALMFEGPVVVAHLPYVSVRWASVCPNVHQVKRPLARSLPCCNRTTALFVCCTCANAPGRDNTRGCAHAPTLAYTCAHTNN